MIKKLILVFAFIAIIASAIFIYKFKNDNQSYTDFRVDIKKYISDITNRETLISDNIVYFGSSMKQLENGYYDLKIQLLQDRVKLNINCLSKDLSKENFNEEYFAEFCSYISKTLAVKLQHDKMYQNIKNSYLKLRSNYDQKIEDIEYIDNGYSIRIYESGCEICLEIIKL